MNQPFDSQTANIQLQQATASAQHFFTLLVQGWAALVATDALLLGYAVAQRQAWVILLAAVMPVSMVYISVVIFKQCLPLAVVGLRMEAALSLGTNGMFATYLHGRMPVIYRELKGIAASDDDEVRAKALAELGRRWILFPPSPGLGPAITAISTGAQVAFFLLAVLVFDYKFM